MFIFSESTVPNIVAENHQKHSLITHRILYLITGSIYQVNTNIIMNLVIYGFRIKMYFRTATALSLTKNLLLGMLNPWDFLQPSIKPDNVRSWYVVRNNVEHLCNYNLLLYYVNPNMYK